MIKYFGSWRVLCQATDIDLENSQPIPTSESSLLTPEWQGRSKLSLSEHKNKVQKTYGFIMSLPFNVAILKYVEYMLFQTIHMLVQLFEHVHVLSTPG